MRFISDFISKIIAIALVSYVLLLFFTPDKCTKVHRSSIPITYTFKLIQYFGEHWMSLDTKLMLLKAQVNASIAAEEFFEKTIYGVSTDESKKEVFQCNP